MNSEAASGECGSAASRVATTEGLKILWEEYKLRQTHYWASFNRFALAVITVSTIPYIKPDLVNVLGKRVFFFPIVSCGITVVCSWILAAEYYRLRLVKTEYDCIMRNSGLRRQGKPDRWEQLFRLDVRLGLVVTVAFAVCGLLLAMFGGLALYFWPPAPIG